MKFSQNVQRMFLGQTFHRLIRISQTFEMFLKCSANVISNFSGTFIEHFLADFNEFLIGVRDQFGQHRLKYNLHLLRHLTESIRHWRPCWALSGLIFEACNLRFITYVKSLPVLFREPRRFDDREKQAFCETGFKIPHQLVVRHKKVLINGSQ